MATSSLQGHYVKPNTHRRHRLDETIEWRRVGGVNKPAGSRDPIYNCVLFSLIL